MTSSSVVNEASPRRGSVTSTIAIGRYVLDVGRRSGTSISLSTNGNSGEARPLAIALKRGDGGHKHEKPVVAALADGVDDASEATAAAERAVALFTALAEGRALDPKVLSSEIDALLGVLERLDRDGRWEEALRLAQSLSALLALVLRWAELLKALSVAARAAEELGDWPALAWARHELGTLHIAAEDPSGADERLGQAREIRQRLGDRRGLAATDRNLQILCQQLRQLVRDGGLRQERGVLQRVLRPKALLCLTAVMLAVTAGAVGTVRGGSGADQALVEEASARQGSERLRRDPDNRGERRVKPGGVPRHGVGQSGNPPPTSDHGSRGVDEATGLAGDRGTGLAPEPDPESAPKDDPEPDPDRWPQPGPEPEPFPVPIPDPTPVTDPGGPVEEEGGDPVEQEGGDPVEQEGGDPVEQEGGDPVEQEGGDPGQQAAP